MSQRGEEASGRGAAKVGARKEMASLEQRERAKDGGVVAPTSLGGLFAESDEEEEAFEQQYAEQAVVLCDETLVIRQYCWHMANANKVWPGTFTLADFITRHKERYSGGGDMLELGAATGALSIYLRKVFSNIRLCTTDIDDGGDVEENIRYNFERNGLQQVPHIAHTWGKSWKEDASHIYAISDTFQKFNFKFIIASDILLYVSAYPALVNTLKEIFRQHHSSNGEGNHPTTLSPEEIQPIISDMFNIDTEDNVTQTSSKSKSLSNGRNIKFDGVEFLMSWQRRIAESEIFFQLMREEGFYIYHHGKCIYSFFWICPRAE